MKRFSFLTKLFIAIGLSMACLPSAKAMQQSYYILGQRASMLSTLDNNNFEGTITSAQNCYGSIMRLVKKDLARLSSTPGQSFDVNQHFANAKALIDNCCKYWAKKLTYLTKNLSKKKLPNLSGEQIDAYNSAAKAWKLEQFTWLHDFFGSMSVKPNGWDQFVAEYKELTKPIEDSLASMEMPAPQDAVAPMMEQTPVEIPPAPQEAPSLPLTLPTAPEKVAEMGSSELPDGGPSVSKTIIAMKPKHKGKIALEKMINEIAAAYSRTTHGVYKLGRGAFKSTYTYGAILTAGAVLTAHHMGR